MAGQVIRRDESDNNATNGDPHEIWYRFDGREMGYTGNNTTLDTDYFTSIGNRMKTAPGTGQTGAFRFGTVTGGSHASFDPSVDPINSFEQGSSAGGYTARGGETLQQIAASLWGDSSLWYKLAEANGMAAMGPGTTLAEGQHLHVPAGALSSSHNAETFGVYDPSKALGDTSPTSPKPAKKPGGCGVMGHVIATMISVAVTIVTGSPALANVASQGFLLLTGDQQKFSFKQLAIAQLSAELSGGIDAAGIFNGIGNATVQAAVTAAAANAATQGISVATGLQKKFDWAGRRRGRVIGGVSAFASKALPGSAAYDAKGALKLPATFANLQASAPSPASPAPPPARSSAAQASATTSSVSCPTWLDRLSAIWLVTGSNPATASAAARAAGARERQKPPRRARASAV